MLQMTVIDAYIEKYPIEIKEVLMELKEVILKAAPEATEKLSYQMPTFYLNGNLVHFAVNKNHIGFYPSPSGIEAFAEQLKPYKTSKGAVQFSLGQPIPYAVVSEIVKFRVAENMNKQKK